MPGIIRCTVHRLTQHKKFVPFGTHPKSFANAQDFFYAGNVSQGKARQMAGLTKREFLNELAFRGIKRHYMTQDLSEDMVYAQSGE